jgi:hypothetical protein
LDLDLEEALDLEGSFSSFYFDPLDPLDLIGALLCPSSSLEMFCLEAFSVIPKIRPFLLLVLGLDLLSIPSPLAVRMADGASAASDITLVNNYK